MADDLFLEKGAVYKVDQGDELVTEGVFKGICMLGNDTALVFETRDGITRFINSSTVLYMDLIEPAPVREQPKTQTLGSVYYG
ncbi:MAG: hypothetical protein IKA33_02965, partial [Candidatus Methanomethylophilaceae archaeon]|nr:hypothetical protein [Candidatus Methanomethylophilaceae archaeon]MBR7153061.1 hypothetical protein [Candidatus Methanomethylophilaceae archaeon]